MFLVTSCTGADISNFLEKKKDEIEDIAKRDDLFDKEIDVTRDEFRNTIRPHISKIDRETKQDFEPDIPEFAPVILAPEPASIKREKRVTLSITEEIDIKDVMLELARLADLELALDPNISGGIILSVNERPVTKVIEMVSDLAGLRHEVEDGILKVLKDDPYLINYSVDFLNIVRSSSGSVSVSSSSGSDTVTSGSSNSIEMSYDGDLWKSIEENIIAILEANLHSLNVNAESSQGNNNNQQNQNQGPTSYYTINKQAGIISIMSDSRKHKAIKKYLDGIRASMSAQVLIEAKIVEVKLNEGYGSGVDWRKLFRSETKTGNPNSGPPDYSAPSFIKGPVGTAFSFRNGDISGIMTFLETFGTTRTLQNPRVLAMNNQQAVITFAENKPYYTVKGTLQQVNNNNNNNNNNNTPIAIESELHTLPIGIVLSLQPSINMQTKEITMSIRPSLTVAGDPVKDPAAEVLLEQAGVKEGNSAVPSVEVREMDTILKIKSGDVMVIGGMIKHSDQVEESGMPFMKDIPIFGNAFKKKGHYSEVQETVILIRATIIGPDGYYDKQDRKIYETFTQDPRPLVF